MARPPRIPRLAALAAAFACVAAHAEEPPLFPSGVYTFEITSDESLPDVPADVLPLLVGQHVVTFTSDGMVSHVVDGNLATKGRYASTPESLTMTDEEGPAHCLNEGATGTYKWTREGDSVRLTAREDTCRWRAFAFTRTPWRLKGASPGDADAPTLVAPADPAAGPGDGPPVPLRLTKPNYPQRAFMARVEGTVRLEILINAEGNVTRARVIESVPSLDEAAIACVMEWKFKPARKNGKPVSTIATVPIRFRIGK